MRNLNTETIDDRLILAHSRAVVRHRDYAARCADLLEETDYEAACLDFERGDWCGLKSPHIVTESDCRQIKSNATAQHAVQTGGVPASAQAAAEAVAPEQWHSEAPPVTGVYIADTARSVADNPQAAAEWHRHWDGYSWSGAWLCANSEEHIHLARAATVDGLPIQWLRLIEADAPVAPPKPPLLWLRGDQVPESERTGLWHRRFPCGEVERALHWGWMGYHEYIRAAHGVRWGDAFDASLYAKVK